MFKALSRPANFTLGPDATLHDYSYHQSNDHNTFKQTQYKAVQLNAEIDQIWV